MSIKIIASALMVTGSSLVASQSVWADRYEKSFGSPVYSEGRNVVAPGHSLSKAMAACGQDEYSEYYDPEPYDPEPHYYDSAPADYDSHYPHVDTQVHHVQEIHVKKIPVVKRVYEERIEKIPVIKRVEDVQIRRVPVIKKVFVPQVVKVPYKVIQKVPQVVQRPVPVVQHHAFPVLKPQPRYGVQHRPLIGQQPVYGVPNVRVGNVRVGHQYPQVYRQQALPVRLPAAPGRVFCDAHGCSPKLGNGGVYRAPAPGQVILNGGYGGVIPVPTHSTTVSTYGAGPVIAAPRVVVAAAPAPAPTPTPVAAPYVAPPVPEVTNDSHSGATQAMLQAPGYVTNGYSTSGYAAGSFVQGNKVSGFPAGD